MEERMMTLETVGEWNKQLAAAGSHLVILEVINVYGNVCAGYREVWGASHVHGRTLCIGTLKCMGMPETEGGWQLLAHRL